MKSNKQVIEELKEYLLGQPHAIVAHALAGLMVDMHRIVNLQSLDQSEKEILFYRLSHNDQELMDFVNGKRDILKCENYEST